MENKKYIETGPASIDKQISQDRPNRGELLVLLSLSVFVKLACSHMFKREKKG